MPKHRNFDRELILLLLEALHKEDRCEYCGKSEVSANHIIPLFKNGENKLSNINFLCKDCMKDTHRLGFEHGDRKSYNREYQKWYYKNFPEAYRKHLATAKRWRDRQKAKASKSLTQD